MPKVGNAIICDQAYVDETSRKVILAGVVSGGIVVGEFPTGIRFSLYLELFVESSAKHDVLIEFLIGRKRVGRGQMSIQGDDPALPGLAIMNEIQLTLDRADNLKVRVSFDGGRAITAINKPVSTS